MSSKTHFIAITTGDVDGIGLEITLKALCKLGPQKNCIFIVYKSAKTNHKYLTNLSKKFEVIKYSSTKDFIINQKKINSYKHLVLINSNQRPPNWVVDATRLCLSKKISGIATAPMSKTLIASTGLPDKGHTDIFKRLCRTKNVFMCFLGTKFNVFLLTDHIPIQDISKHLNKLRIQTGLTKALSIVNKNHRPIAVLGLNPHAGEEGLLGQEEKQNIIPIIKKMARSSGKKIIGPLSPDVCFQKKYWDLYAMYVCPYHDQGLIPFKMIHGRQGGIHLSVGLPFIRTSVDHGTAKDIYGKNIADWQPMKRAIEYCVQAVSS